MCGWEPWKPPPRIPSPGGLPAEAPVAGMQHQLPLVAGSERAPCVNHLSLTPWAEQHCASLLQRGQEGVLGHLSGKHNDAGRQRRQHHVLPSSVLEQKSRFNPAWFNQKNCTPENTGDCIAVHCDSENSKCSSACTMGVQNLFARLAVRYCL